ncbi:MAG: RidA family protein [Alphaproteobacteria bacterium]|nr:MAG: RidA family protein [Alphaproteobacteria bacterium]
MSVAQRLRDLGIALPAAAPPAANYVPFVRAGDLLFIAGQLPFVDGRLQHPGTVGADVAMADAVAAARYCGLNIIAQINAACEGDLERVRRIVRLGGFVASASGFHDQPKVVDGASDLMVAVFGDAGRHARAAVGTNALPRGACVEIDAIAQIA